MLQIIPSILAISEKEYEEKIQKIWDSNLFDKDWVHIDLMDNRFVQNQSIEAEVIKKYPMEFKYEIHLMVEDPYSWVQKLADFPNILRYIIHTEVDRGKIEQVVDLIKNKTKAEIGFALNPETQLKMLEEKDLMKITGSILIMTVHPGFSGQDFIVGELEKIKECARLRELDNLNYLVGVDGGVNESNIKQIHDQRADYVIVGSHLLEGNIDENLEKIRQAI